MLETFVSSKIRRVLLEYILTHPTDRFYLRGLAKELNLTVSPLRRELKRLERSGMLIATPEANILFYTVKTASPAFLELRRVGLVAVEPGPTTAPVSAPVPQPSLRGPILVGAATVGLALLLVVTSVSYLSTTNQRLMSQASRSLTVRKAEVTLVVPPAPAMMMGGPGQPSAPGTMKGGRWQVVPGGFGGFSSASNSAGATQESY